MNENQIKIFKFIAILLMILSTIFWTFLFLQSNISTPLVLHFVYNFGDFVANKLSLIYILVGIWGIFITNMYLSKIIKINFNSLSDLIIITNLINSTLFLILSLQIFLNNI